MAVRPASKHRLPRQRRRCQRRRRRTITAVRLHHRQLASVISTSQTNINDINARPAPHCRVLPPGEFNAITRLF